LQAFRQSDLKLQCATTSEDHGQKKSHEAPCDRQRHITPIVSQDTRGGAGRVIKQTKADGSYGSVVNLKQADTN